MTMQTEIKVDVRVRDRAELGGEVVAMYGDAAKVRWNNGYRGRAQGD